MKRMKGPGVFAYILAMTFSSISSAEEDDPFHVTLPSGVKVEIVGVVTNGSPLSEGWKPDGGPLGAIEDWPEKIRRIISRKGEIISIGDNGEPDKNARDLLWRFYGFKSQPSIKMSFPNGSYGWSSPPLSDPYYFSAGYIPQKPMKHITVRLGMTDEPWGTTQEVSTTGEFLNDLTKDDYHLGIYQSVKVLRVSPSKNDQTSMEIALEMPAEYQTLFDFKLVAINDQNTRMTSNESSTSYEPGPLKTKRTLFTSRFDLPEDRLARFEYKLRPYRYWITYENVSFEPDQMTEVKISVETVTDPEPQ